MKRLLLWCGLAAACGKSDAVDGSDSAADTAVCEAAYDVSWQGWADGFFATYCRSCHSADAPDRHGAPESVNFDTFAQVQAQADLIRWAVLEAESMPVGGGVYPDDLTLLEAFLDCGI